MIRFVLMEQGGGVGAWGVTFWTARVEAAAGGEVAGVGDFASELEFHWDVGVWVRHCGEEGSCVGVLGVGEEGFVGGEFDDSAGVHDCDAVADVFYDAEIVGYEDVCQVELLLEFLEEVDDLGLDGNVEGRDGLVGDDECRLHDQGAGDADALSLAAAEGVRIADGMVRTEAYLFENVDDAVFEFCSAGNSVNDEGFADNVADGHAGV